MMHHLESKTQSEDINIIGDYTLKEYKYKYYNQTITGTIFPDLAKVTTGKDTPFARANDVKAFALTYMKQ